MEQTFQANSPLSIEQATERLEISPKQSNPQESSLFLKSPRY